MIGPHAPIFLPLGFLAAALLVPLAGAVRRSFAPAVAVAATAAVAALSLTGLATVLADGPLRYRVGGWAPPIGIELLLDPLSAFIASVVSCIALLVLVHSRRVVEHETPDRVVPYYSAAMVFLCGLTGMTLTGDLFNLYVFLEISSLSGYALLGVGNRQAPLSAFRYLTLGTAGGSFYLLGLAFLYFETGSLNMVDVGHILPLLPERAAVTVGLVLMTLGMGLKMALFPLHGWLPDAYTNAASTSTALVAPIGTKVAAYVLLRLFFFVLGPETSRDELPLLSAVGYLGAAGVIWGSILAISKSELKRMLAYSSVAQVGYIAVGIGLGSPLGFIGAVLHTVNHACMKACLFLVSSNLRVRQSHTQIPRFDQTLRRAMPWSMAAFALAAISMIGLPPTAGFFSKWYLVLGALEQSNWVFLGTLLLSSLLNAVYFFRVLERIYLVRPPEADPAAAAPAGAVALREVEGSMLVTTLLLAASLLVLGLLNAWLVTHVLRPMLPAGL
ncbi:MAG: complex I subunit 5 family protein [Deferrisomatales bacterium]